MKLTVNGTKAFSVLSDRFMIYSPEAFTLQYSADGINFTSWDEMSQPGNTAVVNSPSECYFKLGGVSEDNVAVIKY